MEKEPSLVAIVNSPSKDAYKRKGKGFSLKEIKEAGKTIELLKKLNIAVDFYRKSAHQENIERLKALKEPKIEKKKKKPFVMKEKKRTPFRPKIEKKKLKAKRPIKEKPEITPVKAASKPKKKEKVKLAKVEKVTPKVEGTPLTELTGLGDTTATKFFEIGVNSVEELCQENPEELAALIKGVSLERLKKWIEEGKQLLK